MSAQKYDIKTYGIDQGLPSSEVYEIMEARDRNLWLATFRGVARFDGMRFTTYTKEDGLNSNLPRGVYEDSKGRLWIGFWLDGLNMIKDGKVHRFEDPLLERFKGIIQFYEAADGTIYICATGAIIAYRDNSFSLVLETTRENQYRYPNEILQTPDGKLWIATLGQGLYQIDPDTNEYKRFTDQSHGINNIVYSLAHSADGTGLLLGSYGSIYEYREGSFTEAKIPGNADRNRVWDMEWDEKQRLWVGLYGNGVMQLDEQLRPAQHITRASGLTDEYVYDLQWDREGNLWIATQHDGLSRFRDFSWATYTTDHDLPSNNINDLITVGDSLYMATDNGAYVWHQGTITRKLRDGYVYAFAKAQSGKIHFTDQNSHGQIDGTATPNSEDTFYTLATHPSGDVLYAGNRNLKYVNQGEPYTQRVVSLTARTAQPLGSGFVLGTNNGLLHVTRDTTRLIPDLPSDLRSVQSSVSLGEDAALFGNTDYLIHLWKMDDGFGHTVFNRSRFGDLRGFNALAIQGETLWIASTGALAAVHLPTLLQQDRVEMTTYLPAQGLIPTESSDNALTTDDQGRIYVGTSGGFQIFDPNEGRANDLAPEIVLDEFQLFSRPLGDSLYKQDGGYHLAYDQNHVGITYAATAMTYPEGVRYRYRLLNDGDGNWSEPTTETSAVYPFLPPGDYNFQVTASNGNGVWQENPSSVSFVISPALWQRAWFQWGMVFFAVGLLMLGLWYRNRQRLRRQRHFSQGLIHAQEQERQRLSRELHDGLGQKLLLIKNTSHTAPGKVPELVDGTLDEIRALSRKLHPVGLEKFGLTKAIVNMVEEVNEATEMLVTEDVDNIDGELPREKEIYLYRIVQECLNNIIKHSEATASKVSIDDTDERITVTVQDNGKGFKMERGQGKVRSFGLQSLSERVDFLKGRIDFETAPGRGTKIIITLYKAP